MSKRTHIFLPYPLDYSNPLSIIYRKNSNSPLIIPTKYSVLEKTRTAKRAFSNIQARKLMHQK